MNGLYYKTHVTIAPDFDRLGQVEAIATQFHYHMGKLLLLKKEDENSHKDMFFTARHQEYTLAVKDLKEFMIALHKAGFGVIRYKIENVVLDSKIVDILEMV